jgi:hypothetical protein
MNLNLGLPQARSEFGETLCELKYLTLLGEKSKGGGGRKWWRQGRGSASERIRTFSRFDTLETNAKDLFATSVADNSVGLVLSRAKLRSICSSFEVDPRADRKMCNVVAMLSG